MIITYSKTQALDYKQASKQVYSPKTILWQY